MHIHFGFEADPKLPNWKRLICAAKKKHAYEKVNVNMTDPFVRMQLMLSPGAEILDKQCKRCGDRVYRKQQKENKMPKEEVGKYTEEIANKPKKAD